MSITVTARAELGARVIGHDDIRPVSELPSGLIQTTQNHTVMARPSSLSGDTRSGPVDVQETETVPVAELPERRKGRRQKALPAPAVIQVSVTMAGFGTIPTEYCEFDVGRGVLHLGLTERSWAPETAMRSESGEVTNVYKFDKAPGRIYVHLGFEYMHGSVRHLVLVEMPNKTEA